MNVIGACLLFLCATINIGAMMLVSDLMLAGAKMTADKVLSYKEEVNESKPDEKSGTKKNIDSASDPQKLGKCLLKAFEAGKIGIVKKLLPLGEITKLKDFKDIFYWTLLVDDVEILKEVFDKIKLEQGVEGLRDCLRYTWPLTSSLIESCPNIIEFRWMPEKTVSIIRNSDRLKMLRVDAEKKTNVSLDSDAVKVRLCPVGEKVCIVKRKSKEKSCRELYCDDLYIDDDLFDKVYIESWDTAEIRDFANNVICEIKPYSETSKEKVSLPSIISDIQWSRDGSKICTILKDSAQFWDSMTGQAVSTLHQGLGGKIAWSADGKKVAIHFPFDQEGTVEIWNIASNVLITKIKFAHRIYDMAWSPDGGMICSIGSSKLHLWDTSKAEIYYTDDCSGSVNSIEWSPDGKLIAISSVEGTRVCFVNEKKHLDIGNDIQPCRCIWNPDSNAICIVYSCGFAVWDIRKKRRISIDLMTCAPEAVTWSPDGTRLFLGDSIWRLSTMPLDLVARTDLTGESIERLKLLLDTIGDNNMREYCSGFIIDFVIKNIGRHENAADVLTALVNKCKTLESFCNSNALLNLQDAHARLKDDSAQKSKLDDAFFAKFIEKGTDWLEL